LTDLTDLQNGSLSTDLGSGFNGFAERICRTDRCQRIWAADLTDLQNGFAERIAVNGFGERI
ncbi:MAG: hypothetical protein ACPGWR_33505, partial [Ardenticatenaceae bacterium]